ncbi:hypothetical protein [uncultured Maribacter sp.]|uniref:glucosamine inositolphosphorylceramide transferase family protein n=1 Tax=uncultured Maribacter sp. TaxID=431308 RepID=UPI00261C2655|nr:hypothetical protein [uncultured Maribacter sp.]
MKIGLIIYNTNHLPSWQLRLIEYIFANPKLELVLIVSKAANCLEKNNLLKFLITIQTKIERKLFFKRPFLNNRSKIEEKLKNTKQILLEEGFSNNDQALMKNIELVLNLENITYLPYYFLNSKYGVWSLKYGLGSSIYQNAIGFLDVINKSSSIKVNLIRHTFSSKEIIDNAWFNRHWSITKTNDILLESSVILIEKNLNKIEKIENTVFPAFIAKNNELTITNFISYILMFNIILLKKFYSMLSNFFLKKRNYCFTIFVGKGNAMKLSKLDEKPIFPDKGEFWADPFIFPYNSNNYIFFENFSYKTKKGKISCGIIKNNKIINKTDVLELNTHLSYPYIFKENGDIFLMPENTEKGGLHIYKCIEFPNKWELYSSCFKGERIADASFFKDKNNQKWLFLNKGSTENVPLENELYIYKIDSLKFNTIISHKENPVLIDSRVARNAGATFNFQNKVYRPSQANIEGIYGKHININKIEILNIDEYKERIVKMFEPNIEKGFIAMHHLHQIENIFAYDAAFKTL